MSDEEMITILARELFVQFSREHPRNTPGPIARRRWYRELFEPDRDVWRERAMALIESLRLSEIAVRPGLYERTDTQT